MSTKGNLEHVSVAIDGKMVAVRLHYEHEEDAVAAYDRLQRDADARKLSLRVFEEDR